MASQAGSNVSRPSAGTALCCAHRAAALAALGLASAVRSTEPLKGLGPSGDDRCCTRPRNALTRCGHEERGFPSGSGFAWALRFYGPAGPRSRRAPREQPGTGRRLAPPLQSPTCCARACCDSCGGRSCLADADFLAACNEQATTLARAHALFPHGRRARARGFTAVVRACARKRGIRHPPTGQGSAQAVAALA